MKSFFAPGLSTLALIFLLFGLQTTVASCTKTVTRTASKDTAITIQLLTSRQWKLQYIHGVSDNDTVFYTRGGAYNVDFDPQTITFNPDFTGTVIPISSVPQSLTWGFLNQSNSSLSFVVDHGSAPDETYSWDNMSYRNDSLLIDQFSSYQGVNSQAEIVWIGVRD